MLYTIKTMANNRYLLNSGTPERTVNLYDNTHNVIFYNEGTDSVKILFGIQSFGVSNFETLGVSSFLTVETRIAEMNPSERSFKLRLVDASSSAYVRVHQLVTSRR
ncbi:hypothetical protein CMI47_10600 [Candidatus Pacearchaeota archaeon]|nr:hypothetical protein [Candidatus Pacearchaeota archaeon]|tara:strand:+ start:2372 stop:2689 length:318 start_codon:yes stop_codon:yes gene_type:complete